MSYRGGGEGKGSGNNKGKNSRSTCYTLGARAMGQLVGLLPCTWQEMGSWVQSPASPASHMVGPQPLPGMIPEPGVAPNATNSRSDVKKDLKYMRD